MGIFDKFNNWQAGIILKSQFKKITGKEYAPQDGEAEAFRLSGFSAHDWLSGEGEKFFYGDGNHKLDTQEFVFFYEQEFYVLSNFSSFSIQWNGLKFDTSEAAYHWEKFPHDPDIQDRIRLAPSAHEAFQIAQKYKELRRIDWDAVKIDIMKEILRAKVNQHEYVKRKLLETHGRALIEDSWRDDYWGWGPKADGKNMLGKLWEEIRLEVAQDTISKFLKLTKQEA